MSKFIRVYTQKYKEDLFINIDQISVIWEKANTILMNGSHAEGNGLLNITQESMNKLLKKKLKGRTLYER